MGTVSITIGVILIIIAFAAFALIKGDAKAIGIIPLTLGASFLIVSIGVLQDEHIPKIPTALDVYRGNTTLEITYRDSVPIDSVVVFKN